MTTKMETRKRKVNVQQLLQSTSNYRQSRSPRTPTNAKKRIHNSLDAVQQSDSPKKTKSVSAPKPLSATAVVNRRLALLESEENGGIDTCSRLTLDDIAAPADVEQFRQALAATASKHEQTATSPTKNAKSPVGKAPSKGIELIRMGLYEAKAWYPSPFQEPLASCPCIFVCEFCLKCVTGATLLQRHMTKCIWRHPPGNEIYRDGNISFWEVDGKTATTYCQNLCLIAKLFLDHKTLYFDVEPFNFYIMTENSDRGCHIIGYFSKEKQSMINCNLSCILTMPQHQRKGYGRLLIDFSYLLSKVEGRIGSPEHPLSDMGLLTYRKYWKNAVLDYMLRLDDAKQFCIRDLSQETGIHPNDIVSTLQHLMMVKYYKGSYVVCRNKEYEEYKRKRKHNQGFKLNPDRLDWAPQFPC